MKREKENYIPILIAVFLLFTIAMIYGTYYIGARKPDTDPYFSEYNKELKNELNTQLEFQSEMDDKIKDIITNGDYTLENPCVLINPYGISPLSALIIFNTKNETSISVSINDEAVTTVKETKQHIIPIYGLYANANNIVKLTTDTNETKEVTILTEALNDNIKSFDVAKSLKDKSHLFMLGSLNKNNPSLRGFDHNNNLVFYLKFGTISKANFFTEHMQIAYNSNYKLTSNDQSIKLELDYLGRIYAIYKSTDDLSGAPNLDIEGDSYLSTPVDIYNKVINNYELKKISDTTSETKAIALKTSEIGEKLIDAKTFTDTYSLAMNGSFISYDFGDKDVTLILTSKTTNYSYSYDLKDNSSLRTDLKGEYSIYIITNGTYYTLLTTINL